MSLGKLPWKTVVLVVVLVGVLGGAGYAAIPASNGTITACYHQTNGKLRLIDSDAGESCTKSETELSWSQTGPQGPAGPAGPAGPQGETGPAGPTLLASGLVNPDGTVGFTSGSLATITRTGPGTYGFAISGLGTGCPLPQLTPYGGGFTLEFHGGVCGGGHIDTTVRTSDGQDHHWAYLMVGQPAPSGAGFTARSAGGAAALPGE